MQVFQKESLCIYKYAVLLKDNTDKLNMKNLEEEVKKLKSEIKDLSDDIESKEKIILKDVDDLKKCQGLLNIREVEINDLKNECEMKNQECKNMSEVNTKLVKENKYLEAAKADLLKKIECKDSVFLEIKSKINCDECDYQASTSKELIVHIPKPHITRRVQIHNCKECRITFKKELDLKIHNAVKHPDKLVGK